MPLRGMCKPTEVNWTELRHACTPYSSATYFILFYFLSFYIQGGPKNGPPVFWDNFGNLAAILTILSLLQAEIYGA